LGIAYSVFAAWPVEDRAAVLALREEQAEVCEHCGHPRSQCRDPKTAGQWSVVTEVCQPSRVAQAVAEDNSKTRGVVVLTRRTGG
jgi:hypothetical protein